MKTTRQKNSVVAHEMNFNQEIIDRKILQGIDRSAVLCSFLVAFLSICCAMLTFTSCN